MFGGMGGCAMIGQSVINVTSGGRGRLSTFTAGAFLLFLLAVLGPFVGRIPMPALVAIMIMVSIGTFSWNSIPNLRCQSASKRDPRSASNKDPLTTRANVRDAGAVRAACGVGRA